MKTTLLIMAAGLGSRYGGDKQIDRIGPAGDPLMKYSIYDAVRAGFNKIVFVIKYRHREIIEEFCRDIKGVEIALVYQEFDSIPAFYKIPNDRVKPFGTVHAVLCAADAIHEPFAVINADDFYGEDAFRVMHEELVTLAAGQATMVAYRLKNTVSRNGAVTRGVCSVEDGKLAAVTETYKITVDDAGVICDADSGVLDPEAPVSMNMWGFTADVFDYMKTDFDRFLRGIAPDNIKAEYTLPEMIDKMLREKLLTVSVLTTDAVWFGVTYKEDRATVAAELARMHEEKLYPEKLF